MENESQRELEELIQRELEQLPDLAAPSTLIPRVIAAIQAHERAPWWQRPWLNWPLPIRCASVTLLLVLVGATMYGVSHGSQTVGDVVSRDVGKWFAIVSPIAQVLGTLGNALLLIVRSLQTPWLIAILAGAFMIYLACIGLGTLCFQLALKSANRASK